LKTLKFFRILEFENIRILNILKLKSLKILKMIEFGKFRNLKCPFQARANPVHVYNSPGQTMSSTAHEQAGPRPNHAMAIRTRSGQFMSRTAHREPSQAHRSP
jgi:hypothetical protein